MAFALKRRDMVSLGTALLAMAPRSPGHAEFTPGRMQVMSGRGEWEAFKQLYLSPDGRIVDTANGGTSHSEGQGWGLLLAEAFNDEPIYNRILSWSRRALRRPQDALLAWAWRPGQAVAVADPNNATDGDIFMAWALARGARRWQRPELRELAEAVARDLHQACVRPLNGRQILLPAAFGFEHADYLVVNPSYYVMPAFNTLAELMPEGRWREVREDGLGLLRDARFGQWGLPADWIRLPRNGNTPPVPAPGWAPRFSYDAVRVPLYLAWAGLEQEPAAQAASRFWSSGRGGMPAWTDFSEDSLAPYPADSGFVAVARLVQDRGIGAGELPRVREAPHYYAAALTLLARLAAFERPPMG